MGIYIGNKIKLSIFGQSHSRAIGFVLEGLPAGIKVDTEIINYYLKRRAPIDSSDTSRIEEDKIEILSGVKNKYSCGSPIAIMIENKNTDSSSYEAVKYVPRPGHSDYPAFMKFHEYHDYAGGGEFSGRLTAAIVAASGILIPELKKHDINIAAHILNIGSVYDDKYDEINPITQMLKLSPRPYILINKAKAYDIKQEIDKYRKNKDSIGGSIECAIVGMKAGSGSTMFDSLESRLSMAIFSIPAVKGIDFGNQNCHTMSATAYNDEYIIKNDKIMTATNNCGGILGGLSNGMPIIFSVKLKPTPSIASAQKSISLHTNNITSLELNGRFDACIVPRAVSCIEAAAALVCYDYL